MIALGREGDPRPDAGELLDELDEHLGLLPAGDGFEGQEVDAGGHQRLDAGPVPQRQVLARHLVRVLARVLGAVVQRGAVRADRARDERPNFAGGVLLHEGVDGLLGCLHGPRHELEALRLGEVEVLLEAVDASLVSVGDDHLGARSQEVQVGLHDGARVRGEEARAPQRVAVDLLAGDVLLQLRREAPVQEHRFPARAHGSAAILWHWLSRREGRTAALTLAR